MRLKPFVIACERDFYGGDLKFQSAADVDTCLDVCAVNGACVGVSYVARTKTCYLKSSIGRALYNTNVTGTCRTYSSPRSGGADNS
jgi:hypothetical protein